MSRQSKNQTGASRKAAYRASKKNTSNVPAWVWMFTGIVTGLFIAFLMKLAPNAVDVSELQETTQAPAESTEEHKAVFDFYTLLPESEILIPGSSNNTISTRSTETTKKPPTKTNVYLLQAGSFRSASDADRLRAQLTLEGLDVKIQKVTIRGSETWHRVQVGPFNNTTRLEQARKTLSKLNINPLPLKLK